MTWASEFTYLNREQFDSVRAGDWYCKTCPSNHRGNTDFRYFWQRELEHPIGAPAPASAEQ